MMKKIKGSTLLELLVVIAIIGILMSLIIVLAGGSRDKAARVKCASNLRGLGIALNLYIVDHDDYLPAVQNTHGITWDTRLLPYLQDTREVFLCPADPWRSGNGSNTNQPRTYAANGGVVYGGHVPADLPFNGYGTSRGAGIPKLSSAGKRFFMIGERPGDAADNRGYCGEHAFSGMDVIPGKVHENGPGGNYLMSDNAVEYFTTNDVADAGDYYWYISGP
jgi:type II secretory pathway pseudopilin PulG